MNNYDVKDICWASPLKLSALPPKEYKWASNKLHGLDIHVHILNQTYFYGLNSVFEKWRENSLYKHTHFCVNFFRFNIHAD